MTTSVLPRSMPSVDTIVDYWRVQDVDWLRSWCIGWGEPFCFACGWLPPVADGRRDSWKLATKWLDRAHLQDRAAGGTDEPHNLVMLCHLCHEVYPESDTVEAGLQWVKNRPTREFLWQFWTDSTLYGQTPTRPTTLIRSRMEFLEAMREVDAA